MNISTRTSSFNFRTPLTESAQNDTSIFDLIAHSRKLCMDVAVWDMYPGLTEEEALLGARHMDSTVNTVRVQCRDLHVKHFISMSLRREMSEQAKSKR